MLVFGHGAKRILAPLGAIKSPLKKRYKEYKKGTAR